MSRFNRIILGAMIVGFALLAPSASTASAAFPSNTSTGTVATSGAHLAGTAVPSSPTRPLPAPAGCPAGAVCFYQQSNGGILCGVFYKNAPDLGGCTNNADSVYNNGEACGGCQDVGLYWGSGYQGAWYCLPMKSYLLYMEQNSFSRVGTSAQGLNQQMKNNVASAKWLSC
jgi:hypothetical protein